MVPGTPRIEYRHDPTVDEALDAQLRGSLTICFPGPMFRDKRCNAEMPAHRWIVRDGPDRLAAHAAAHDKRVSTQGEEVRLAGIAEVCVHPDHRGLGLVRHLLQAAHLWIEIAGIPLALLFVHKQVYASSGYRPVAVRTGVPCPAARRSAVTDL